MPNEKKELKKAIKELNKNIKTKVNYNDVYRNVQDILSKEGDERETAFVEYCKQLGKEIFDKVAEMRTMMYSKADISNQSQEEMKIAIFSISMAEKKARTIANSMIKIIDPEQADSIKLDIEHYKSLRDWQIEELNSRDTYTELQKAMKGWTRDDYKSEVNALDENFKGYHFTGNFKDAPSHLTALTYCKYKFTKDELEKHGAVWRFFNFRKVAAYRSFLEKAESIFAKVGFDVEKHGEPTLAAMKKVPFIPYNRDVEMVNDTYKNTVNMLKMENIVHLTVARDKFAHGKELDKNPETSYITKLTPFAQKHGMTIEEFKIDSVADFNNLIDNYDKMRNTDLVKNTAYGIFLRTIQYMLHADLKNGREINISEIMKDARHISVMMMEHYTPFYELDEFKDMETPAYIETLTPEKLEERVENYIKKGLPPEKLEAVKKEASDLIKEWKADSGRLANEDRALAGQYGGRAIDEEEINEEYAHEIDQKEPISVSLEEPTSQIEPIKPLKEHDEIKIGKEIE